MPIESLDGLPPELLQSIFGHLPAHFCLTTVARVCPLFYRLVHDENWWNARKKAVNLVVHEGEEAREDFSLQRVICRAEIEETRWKRLGQQKMYSLSAHYGAINSCKLYEDPSGGKRCISAGRDRTIRLWDLNRVVLDQDAATEEEGRESVVANMEVMNGGRKEMLHTVDLAHTGWIWVVTRPNSSNVSYSCGWDNLVKRWQITPAAMQESGQLNLSSAVLGLDWIDGSENELVASTFLRRVSLLDVRENRMECKGELHNEHRNAVIGVASRGNYVYSWGEDRLVLLSDIRNLSTTVAKATIPRSYASQLSIGPTSIVAGTMRGECCYLNPMNLETWGSFNVQSVCEGATKGTRIDPLRGIINTGHSIVTLSKYGTCNALSYGLKPRSLIDSVKLDGEPSRIDYLNDDVVVSMGDGRIVYWPKLSKI